MRDIENTCLQFEEPDNCALNGLLGHFITYRIAVGPHASRKAFTLQTIPAREDGKEDGRLVVTHPVLAPPSQRELDES